MEQIVEYYNLDKEIDYLLFIEGKLHEKGILFDEVYSAGNEKKQRAWDQYLYFEGIKITIVLKNMLLMHDNKKCFNLMWNYFIAQYLRGLYKLTAQDMVRIGGLILFSENNGNKNQLVFSHDRLLPKSKLATLKTEESRHKYKKHILKHYIDFTGTKMEARNEILKFI